MGLQWLLLVAGALLAMTAWVYRHLALRHIGYERTFSARTAYEGDTVEMIERIANRKLLPLPWLRLESLLSSRLVFEKQNNLDIRTGDIFQNHISLFSLRPYRQIVRRHQVRCAGRGWYRLESATMTTGDPFGLTRVTLRCPLSLQLVVYPKPAAWHELPLPSHSWLGDIAVRRWIVEDPFLTSGVRPYRAGDTLRSVNWKATARSGELQVHQREFTADHRLWICLNFEVSCTMWKQVTDPQRIERAIRYAATVAQFALDRGVETGLLCNGWALDGPKRAVRLEPAGGTLQLQRLLEAMAMLELEAVVHFPELLQEEVEAGTAGADFLIISCHAEGGIGERVEELRRLGNGVEVMLVDEG